MNSVYSGKQWVVFIHGRNEQCLFREDMYENSTYSGKTCIQIVLIQVRNECGLFMEEMNSAYLGKNEYCLFSEEMHTASAYLRKKWTVFIQGRNE